MANTTTRLGLFSQSKQPLTSHTESNKALEDLKLEKANTIQARQELLSTLSVMEEYAVVLEQYSKERKTRNPDPYVEQMLKDKVAFMTGKSIGIRKELANIGRELENLDARLSDLEQTKNSNPISIKARS